MYNYDEKKALEASNVVEYIKTSGLYIGEITQAIQINSDKSKAQGVKFSFKCDKGICDFTVWTSGKTGEPVFGENYIHAIMMFNRVTVVSSLKCKIKDFDPATRQLIEVEALEFPALTGAMAVILQAEQYYKKNGEIGTRMLLRHILHPETLQTSAEFKENRPAQAYQKIKVEDIPVKAVDMSGLATTESGYTNIDYAGINDEDHIPF